MKPLLKIIGVGGSGSNTISRIAKFNFQGVELIAANTDAQALNVCKASKKILLGKEVTKGLGAGMDVGLGKKAGEEAREEIEKNLKGADIVFVTCGLGGGTGSGASPIVAEVSKNLGILTIGVVTTPFSFEGEQRRKIACDSLHKIKEKVDSLIVISNDNLLKTIDEKTTVFNAFTMCDEILAHAIKSITDLILEPGIISVDFASLCAVLKDGGRAMFGIGKSDLEPRAVNAAQAAISSPLLDFSIEGSTRILFIISGQDVNLSDVRQAAEVITKKADSKAKIIFGATKDKTLKKGELKATVIAVNVC